MTPKWSGSLFALDDPTPRDENSVRSFPVVVMHEVRGSIQGKVTCLLQIAPPVWAAGEGA